MISVHIQGKSYGDTPVLGEISFQVENGETVALLGPSGIGKTTLLRIIAGIDRSFQGHVTRPENIAMVFQEPTLLPWRSALQNLTLIHPGLGTKPALEILDRVGLADKAAHYPGQLSLGQCRRLALARAFAGRPQLLIMDEPLASLDDTTAVRMLELTEQLITETSPAVLFVTHMQSDAERLTTRILRLTGNAPAILEA